MNLETLKPEIEANVPNAKLEIITNPSPSGQHSLLVDHASAVAVATYLRDAEHLRFDFCSNVTGVDWPTSALPAAPKPAEGEEPAPAPTGYLEAVYHLFSVEKRHGPVILRLRTEDRTDRVHLPSLTPVWRSAEFQEREAFDLFGIVFDGHHDLRRLLMWEEFLDYPMRKDYVEPDDYEYEPTAHDDVLRKTTEHHKGGA